jgi:hypothetical protein
MIGPAHEFGFSGFTKLGEVSSLVLLVGFSVSFLPLSFCWFSYFFGLISQREDIPKEHQAP